MIKIHTWDGFNRSQIVYTGIKLFSKNVHTANTLLSLSLASIYLVWLNHYAWFCNIVLEQVCNLYSDWQIHATCMFQILCDAQQIWYKVIWKIFGKHSSGFCFAWALQGLLSASSKWWVFRTNRQQKKQLANEDGGKMSKLIHEECQWLIHQLLDEYNHIESLPRDHCLKTFPYHSICRIIDENNFIVLTVMSFLMKYWEYIKHLQIDHKDIYIYIYSFKAERLLFHI